jgi:hypothetical protein
MNHKKRKSIALGSFKSKSAPTSGTNNIIDKTLLNWLDAERTSFALY